MPTGLRRIYGAGDWHFITCSCYQRQQFLASVRNKDLFLQILEEVRVKHNLIIGGYVVMPEHFHLLISEPMISEPARGTLSLTMQCSNNDFRARARRSKELPNFHRHFGSGATTTSTFTARVNTRKSCGISTAIR
jgi:REP element-mobilizing transposase RayT